MFKQHYKIRFVRNIVAYRYMKTGRESVVHGRTWYVLGIHLHILLIVAREIYEVDTKLKFVIVESFAITSDPKF
jgi:hypothetical protein